MEKSYPSNLKPSDKVIILSSARKITLGELQPAIELLSLWQLKVVLGQTIGRMDNQFAGNDNLRAEDIQRAIEDKEIKALFFARGGYGSVRILDKVDFSALKDNPKWLIGYSDVTAILMHVFYTQNLCSLHAIMPVNILSKQENSATKSLKNVLFNSHNKIQCPYNSLNRLGCVEGEIIGGNLSVIYSLLGSESFQETQDKILLIEDIDEYLYHIDRMMQALKRSGKLKGLKALIVGKFTDMHDNAIPFGQTAYQIIYQAVQPYSYPVAFDVPIGHIGEENHAIVIGKKSLVTITDKQTTIEQ